MDVIVIGCGAAGVAALRKLHDAGVKVLGLEADERIGGRIHSIEYGDCYLDLGAAWCNGEKGNVIFELANPLGLLSSSDPGEKYFILSNGDLVSSETSDDIVQALNDEIANADKNSTGSISGCIRNAAKSNKTLKKYPELVQSFVEWYENNDHVCGQDDPKMGKSLKGLEEFSSCEGDLLNFKGRGCRTLLDVLLNKYPDPSKELPIPIHLKKEVESIRWGTSKPGLDSGNPLVQIKCKDGSLYAAKSVIITVSLGVLKERHIQLFNPPLPAEKVNAINNLGQCAFDKIYVEFTKPWWPKTPTNFNILWKKGDKDRFSSDEQWVTEISNFSTVEYHPNLLNAWIYGEGAKKMEQTSEEHVKATIVKLLDIICSKEFKVTPVKSVLRTKWALDPFSRGAYSYRSVATEQNGGSSTILSEPLYHGDNFPVVCFAGEATSHRYQGALHGAVESGFREAERLIAFLKK